jgi:hypothetical protein
MELKLSTKFKLVSIMSDNLAQSVALIPQEFQVLHYEFGPQCCVHVGHQRCNQRIGQFLDSKLILIFDQSLSNYTKYFLDSAFQFLGHWTRAHLTRNVDDLFDGKIPTVFHFKLFYLSAVHVIDLFSRVDIDFTIYSKNIWHLTNCNILAVVCQSTLLFN